MKIAFISAPFRASSDELIKQNVLDAQELAEKYWKQGYSVICPNLNSGDGYLELLEKCDLVVAHPRWQESEGARGEIEFARKMGIPVVFERTPSKVSF